MDNIEKLQQLKQLLDEGILTQDEFESRKEQILFPEKIEEERRKEEEEKRQQEEERRKDELFDNAISRFDEKTSASYKQGISELEELGDWRETNILVEKYRGELVEIEKKEKEEQEERDKEALYEKAMNKFGVRTSNSYKSAIADLESLGEWKDAAVIIEERKAELQEIEEEEKKKSKRLKKKLTLAAAAAAVLIVAIVVAKILLTPDLAKYSPTKEKTINSMSFKVPEECKGETTSVTGAILSLRKDDRVIGVIEVEYKGDSDLNGAAGYDSKTDKHKDADEAKELIPDGTSEYKTIEADNSVYEVTVYSNEKVKGKKELLDAIIKTFDVAGYKNPRESEGIGATYRGDSSAGVKIEANAEGLSVFERFKTVKGSGTKDISYTVKDPVTLEAGKTSTLKIKAAGQDYDLNIKCSDHGAFYEDGAFTASLDDIMADYKENYSTVSAINGSSSAGGSIDITQKGDTYGGQFNCNTTNNKYVVTFSSVDEAGDNNLPTNEIPHRILTLVLTNGNEEKEDLMCIIGLFGNMLANINPDIDQNEAYNEVLEALQSTEGGDVQSVERTYKGVSYSIVYTSQLFGMQIWGS